MIGYNGNKLSSTHPIQQNSHISYIKHTPASNHVQLPTVASVYQNQHIPFQNNVQLETFPNSFISQHPNQQQLFQTKGNQRRQKQNMKKKNKW